MIELHNIDCMEYMRTLPDKAFELAIVDPPYGINSDKSRIQRLNGGGGKLKNRILNNSEIIWDGLAPDLDYFNELRRVSVNQIIWGGNYFPLPPTRCVIVWDKVQPWENFSQVEIGWTSFDSPAQLYKFDNRTGDKIHPTQKPIKLYKWCLSKFATPGDRILDTHLGSGSIAIACHDMGFDLVGCELDKDYYEAACKRLKNHQMQQKLF